MQWLRGPLGLAITPSLCCSPWKMGFLKCWLAVARPQGAVTVPPAQPSAGMSAGARSWEEKGFSWGEEPRAPSEGMLGQLCPRCPPVRRRPQVHPAHPGYGRGQRAGRGCPGLLPTPAPLPAGQETFRGEACLSVPHLLMGTAIPGCPPLATH